MLIMRNTINGCIWQAYIAKNNIEKFILTKNAEKNGFIVQIEKDNYTEETSPEWRESKEWKNCLKKFYEPY